MPGSAYDSPISLCDASPGHLCHAQCSTPLLASVSVIPFTESPFSSPSPLPIPHPHLSSPSPLLTHFNFVLLASRPLTSKASIAGPHILVQKRYFFYPSGIVGGMQ